jgi:hypothetical protein
MKAKFGQGRQPHCLVGVLQETASPRLSINEPAVYASATSLSKLDDGWTERLWDPFLREVLQQVLRDG